MATEQTAIENYCTDLYTRTRALWESLEGEYPTWECRFKILYSPPVPNPDLLILGTNPGFDPVTLDDAEIQTWSKYNEYTQASWRLAGKLRTFFNVMSCPEKLENSVGTNLLFFKTKSIDKHRTGWGWKNNPGHITQQLEQYCHSELNKLVAALNPATVLVLGLSAFDKFTDTQGDAVFNTKDRRLAAAGWAEGVPVIGIIHPTGAQVSDNDWALVLPWLAQQLGSSVQQVRA